MLLAESRKRVGVKSPRNKVANSSSSWQTGAPQPRAQPTPTTQAEEEGGEVGVTNSALDCSSLLAPLLMVADEGGGVGWGEGAASEVHAAGLRDGGGGGGGGRR